MSVPTVQRVIHKVEEGGGNFYLKLLLIILAFVALILSYNLRGFKDMSTLEAMDQAQVARNLAAHKGFTTLFVRPFSMHLLEKTYVDRYGPPPVGGHADPAQVRGMHPDLANPPVYPFLLSGLMRLFPKMEQQNVADKTGSVLYWPDFCIALFNQLLFVGAVIAMFFVARKLFDAAVAWTCAAVLLGTDLFWRFSISGLSTILLMLLFMAVAWSLLRLEEGSREGKITFGGGSLLAFFIGILIGLGGLTRYSFAVLMLPALVYLIVFLNRARFIFCFCALAGFALVFAPWIARNYHLSHTPFGTSGYAIYELTPFFPENRLQRSLDPDLTRVTFYQIWSKFINNTRGILLDDLPRFPGNWLGAFFLAGLLVPFRNPTLNRLRAFLLFCLPVLVVTQALARTQQTEDSPVVNSENLLVLLAPWIMLFGISFFYTLLEQLSLPSRLLKNMAIGAFCALLCLPALMKFVSAHITPSAYPPYYPPIIQKTAGWLKEDEMMMSDIPWAVAWYGRRQCLWLTLGLQSDFFQVYDYQKPINAIYLTPATMDAPFLSQFIRNTDFSWGSFVLEYGVLKKELPPSFPLRKALPNWMPDHFILMDTDRWNHPSAP